MRWLRIGVPLILTMGAIYATAAVLTLAKSPREIRRRLIGAVESRCESCHLEIGRVRVGLLPCSVTLEDLHLTEGDPRSTGVDARAERIVMTLSPFPLLRGRFDLSKVAVESPKVVVTEGDEKLPHPDDDGPALGSTKSYALRRTTLSQGEFTYIRVHAGHRARIHVTELEGSADELGTIGPLRQQPARGNLTGRLERSGTFRLTVAMPLYTPGLHLDIELRLFGQPLDELNPFFETGDGVRLSGVLKEGRGAVSIRHRRLAGTVEARYTGLNFHFETTKERGALSAFLSNFVKSLKLNSSTLKSPPRDQARSVEVERASGEPIFKFIFSGMSAAAFRIMNK